MLPKGGIVKYLKIGIDNYRNLDNLSTMLTHSSIEDKPNPDPLAAETLRTVREGRGASVAREADFMSSRELADWLHVSLRTVGNWQRRRVVPFLKVGRVVRFPREQVETALAGLTLLPVVPHRRLRSGFSIPLKK